MTNFDKYKSDLTVRTLVRILEQENDPKFRQSLQIAQGIVDRVRAEGGQALLVGGFVRDEVLRSWGQKIKSADVDLEVYGIPADELKTLLEKFGEVEEVGKSFGVYVVGGLEVSLPRKDRKTGQGHRGIAVNTDPDLDFATASARRDFTINALAVDPETGEVFDAHSGIGDLQQGIIRATDEQVFADDPLRVLRAGVFASRFGFTIDEKTISVAQKAKLEELSPERVGYEWEKLLLLSEKPSIGLEYLFQLGVLQKLHPELAEMINTPQDEKWHPEGNVWEHTKLCVDEMARLVRGYNIVRQGAFVLLLASICHDIGKPEKTYQDDETGRIRSKGHSKAGIKLAKNFLKSIKVGSAVIDQVLPLVSEHQAHRKEKWTDSDIRHLAVDLSPASIEQLVLLGEADLMSRGEKSASWQVGKQILSRAKKMGIEKEPEKMKITGQDLLDLGYTEGEELGRVLDELYQAQLDEKFIDKKSGLEYLKNI